MLLDIDINKEKPDFNKGKIIIIDKPIGWSSFDVVNKIRFKLRNITGNHKIKVGHAGTLDPLASGVLVVCTGKATKLIDGFQDEDKIYSVGIRLGATTPSFDMETEVNNTYDISQITNDSINSVANSFIGINMQVPPKYSAIQINGKRAYEFARQGQEVNMIARQIEIKELEINNISLPEINFIVSCTKGTYIRSLADDFGKRLNNGAYLYYLRRIASGGFNISQAITMENLELYFNKLKTI